MAPKQRRRILFRLSIIAAPAFFGLAVALAIRDSLHPSMVCLAAGLYLSVLAWEIRNDQPSLFRISGAQLFLNLSLVLAVAHIPLDLRYELEGNVRDFLPRYASGWLLRHNPEALYDLSAQLDAQRRATGFPIDEASFIPDPYPPYALFLFVPLSLLAYERAFQVFSLLNLALLSLLIYFLARALRLGFEKTRFLVVIATLWTPTYVVFWQGQTSILLLACLVGFTYAFLRNSQSINGVWCGALALKPQLLPIPALILAASRRWKALLFAALFLLALVAVSFWVVGAAGIKGFADLALQVGDHTAENTGYVVMERERFIARMHNFRALGMFFGSELWFWTGLTIATVFATGWLFRRGQGSDHERLAFAFLTMLLISPHLHTHDLVLAIVPIALVLSKAQGTPSLNMRLPIYVLCLLPLATLTLWDFSEWNWPLVSGLGLGIWVVTFTKLIRQKTTR